MRHETIVSSVDYEVFSQETAAWRSEQLRVYPVLGNHEFKGCMEADCVGGRHFRRKLACAGTALRWEANCSSSRSTAIPSLLIGSEQAKWLKGQLDNLSLGVRDHFALDAKIP